MKVFIAGNNGKLSIIKRTMKTYLVNPSSRPYCILGNDKIKSYKLNILESYYYAKDNKDLDKILPYVDNFLLDSGAFTFLSMKGNVDKMIDWDEYVEGYAKYILSRQVKLFFELDIDSIVGIAEVERLREKLEHLTGLKPIPVWHKNRGKDYFVEMCKNYPYVALGGIVIKEIPRELYERAFPWFINTAHQFGAKIHCLGYATNKLKHFPFDSVDSTTWLQGNRGGFVFCFDPETGSLLKKDTPQEMRLKPREAAEHNFTEWVKFSSWADKNL